jgi:hypothetical protein
MRTLKISLLFLTVVAILTIYSRTADAAGRVIIQPQYFFGKALVLPQFGLSVYEPIVGKNVFLNSYAGYGEVPEVGGVENALVRWATLKNDVEFRMPLGTIGAGITLRYAHPDKVWNNDAHVRVTFRIW